ESEGQGATWLLAHVATDTFQRLTSEGGAVHADRATLERDRRPRGRRSWRARCAEFDSPGRGCGRGFKSVTGDAFEPSGRGFRSRHLPRAPNCDTGVAFAPGVGLLPRERLHQRRSRETTFGPDSRLRPRDNQRIPFQPGARKPLRQLAT